MNASRLPCKHVMCIECLDTAMKSQPAKCAKCDGAFPLDFKLSKEDIHL